MATKKKQPDAIADLTVRVALIERAIHEKLERQRGHDRTVEQHRVEREFHKSLAPLRQTIFDEFVAARLDRTLDSNWAATFVWCAVQSYRRWLTERIETIVDEREREHATLTDDEFKDAMLALGDVEVIVEKSRAGSRHEAYRGVCVLLEFRDTKNDLVAEERVFKNVPLPDPTPEEAEKMERRARAYTPSTPRCGRCREVVST